MSFFQHPTQRGKSYMEACYVAGADPELMVVNPKGNLISGIPLIKGTKEKPLRCKGGALQHDNVMVEFNVEPANSSEEFEHNIRTVLGELSKAIAPNRVLVQAYAKYPRAALRSRKAQVFGCDPDFTPYTEPPSMNLFDTTLAAQPYRSCGGHFHVGFKPQTEDMLRDPYGACHVTKMMDIFLGIPSIVLDRDPSSAERRKLYGKAGAHRPKEYGLEYRALGNFWVHTPRLVQLMYRLADKAVSLTLEHGGSDKLMARFGAERVQRVINTSQVKEAESILKRQIFRYLDAETRGEIMDLAAIDHRDIYGAWGLS